jgi:hypothetical protein
LARSGPGHGPNLLERAGRKEGRDDGTPTHDARSGEGGFCDRDDRQKLSGLRQEFIAAGEPIEADLKSLKRAVHCPADALATD